MSILRNDSLQVAAPKDVDSRYDNDGAGYADITAVNSAILESFRYVGLTVNIQGVEHWYSAGTGDGDLIEKKLSSSLQNISDDTGNSVVIGNSSTAGSTSITVNSSDTNADVVIIPKGTGTLKALGNHQANISEDSDVITLGYFNANNSPANPGGSNTEIQFNNAGSFGASSNLTFSSNTLSVNGTDIDSAGVSFTAPGGAFLLHESISQTLTVGVSNSGSGNASNGAYIQLAGTSNDGDLEMYSGSNGDVVIHTGTTSRLTFTNGGRITTSNYTPNSGNADDLATIGYVNGVASTGVSFGTSGDVPFTNGTTDNYSYESIFSYNSTTNELTIDGLLLDGANSMYGNSSDAGVTTVSGGSFPGLNNGAFIRTYGATNGAAPRSVRIYGNEVTFNIGTTSLGSQVASINSSGDWDFDGNDLGGVGAISASSLTASGTLSLQGSTNKLILATGNTRVRDAVLLFESDAVGQGSIVIPSAPSLNIQDNMLRVNTPGNLQIRASGAWQDVAGSSLTVGSDNRIPYSNSLGNDFDYSSNLVFNNDNTLSISGSSTVTNITGGTTTISNIGNGKSLLLTSSQMTFDTGPSTSGVDFNIGDGVDSGSNPYLNSRFYVGTLSTSVSTRPLWRILNGSTTVATLGADGDWDFSGNNLENIGSVDGVTLQTGGSATAFLNAQGSYVSIPGGSDGSTNNVNVSDGSGGFSSSNAFISSSTLTIGSVLLNGSTRTLGTTSPGDLNLSPTSGNINANSNRITNVTDPTSDQDAATKIYTDLEAFHQTGDYSPTLQSASQLTSSQVNAALFFEIGNVVHVQGSIDISESSFTQTFGAPVVFRMPLPIASNFTSQYDCHGTGNRRLDGEGSDGDAAVSISASTTNNQAIFEYDPVSVISGELSGFIDFSFTYRVR